MVALARGKRVNRGERFLNGARVFGKERVNLIGVGLRVGPDCVYQLVC
jgi:hypothetical protein